MILRYVTAPDGGHHLICRGDQRFRIVEYLQEQPFLAARIERIAEPETSGAEVEARHLQLKERALEALKLIPNVPDELRDAVAGVESPSVLADLVTSFLDLKIEEKQQVLETVDPRSRLDRVLWFLAYRLEVLRLSHDIGQRTREEWASALSHPSRAGTAARVPHRDERRRAGVAAMSATTGRRTH